jgi:hypothetical protein
MGGLVWGHMVQGLGRGASSLAEHQIAQDDRLELQRERLEANSARDAERFATQREIAALKADAAAAKAGGSIKMDEGSMAEEAAAGRLGITIPELRALRASSRTGDASSFATGVGEELDGPTESGGPLNKKTMTAADQKWVADKRRALADIQSEFMHGKDYDEVAKGRRTEIGNEVSRGIVGGAISPEQGGQTIAATEGKSAYKESGGTVTNEFSGSNKTTAVGDSQVKENEADAAEKRFKAAGGVGKDKLIETIDAQRKSIDQEARDLREAKKAELDAAIGPRAKQSIIDAYKMREQNIEARRRDLDAQFDAVRANRSLPPRKDPKNPGDNGNVKSPEAEPANSGPAKPKTKAEYDKLPKGARYVDPEGKTRIKG